MRKAHKKPLHLGLMLEPALHYKLQTIAKQEARSANAQILYLVRKNIAQFEAENGTIELPTAVDTDCNPPIKS